MQETPRGQLPAVCERTIAESDYLALVSKAAEADRLRRELAERGAGASVGGPLWIDSLLVLRDDLARALAAALDATVAVGALRAGVEQILASFDACLQAAGYQAFVGEVGQEFDPELHDLGVMGFGAGSIARTLRPGYRRGQRVVRRALVELAEERP